MFGTESYEKVRERHTDSFSERSQSQGYHVRPRFEPDPLDNIGNAAEGE